MIQYSDDGENWTDIKLDKEQSELSKRDNKTQVFKGLQ